MKAVWGRTAAVLSCTLALLTPAYGEPGGGGRGWVLRAAPAGLEAVAARHGLTVLERAAYGGGQLARVALPDGASAATVEAAVAADPEVYGFEAVRTVALPLAESGLHPTASEVLDDLLRSGFASTPCLAEHLSVPLWSGYADQQAAVAVRLPEAHTVSCGGGIVALLDTGVDPEHPLLAGALVPGYDFLVDEAGVASEWSGLDQSLRPIVEQALAPAAAASLAAAVAGQGDAVLGDPIAPILDQSVRPIVEDLHLPAAFGHGTMVAGLVRLTAPGARLMALRVFDATGSGDSYAVVRAIYYAVDHGAAVINMSFSLAAPSKELREAVAYARRRGATTVAAAGNRGERTLVFPAGYAATIGVAASTDSDELADFSNFGAQLAVVAAPGAGVVSAFPGGLHAAGWGTSFSTPFVSGVAALLVGEAAALTTPAQVETAIARGALRRTAFAGAVESGRLDAFGALLAAGLP